MMKPDNAGEVAGIATSGGAAALAGAAAIGEAVSPTPDGHWGVILAITMAVTSMVVNVVMMITKARREARQDDRQAKMDERDWTVKDLQRQLADREAEVARLKAQQVKP